jgi:hypothetical protein
MKDRIMKFDGKSPEEIGERLLKEGIFTKLLEAANLDQELLERARQEAPLSPEEERDLLKSAVNDILLPRMSGTTAPKNVKEKSHLYMSTIAVGAAVLELIAQAKSSIYATYFAVERYSEAYIALLLEKVKQGLVFERIVYYHQEYKDTTKYKWLDRFYDKNHEPIKRYRQYRLTSNRPPLSYDFMIIDEKYAIVVHRVSITDPESRERLSDEITIFENDMMVRCFLDLWKMLIPQEHLIKGRTAWVNEVVLDDPFESTFKK